jgi:hypothetical protein
MVDRDGNGWIECGQGHRHWGLHGAAGLLLHNVDADGTLRLLLQHRADWYLEAHGTATRLSSRRRCARRPRRPRST